jgi:hypothetical protein
MSDQIQKAVDMLINEYNQEVNDLLKTETGAQEAKKNPEQFLDGISEKLKEMVLSVLSEQLEEASEQKLLQIWKTRK